MGKGFDEYAENYDAWFLANQNVLHSEAALVASTLSDAGRVLSVGCGSGLFEKILRDDYGIIVADGIEPSEGMAAIARKRGVNVIATVTAEDGVYDTILFNGTPSYITDLEAVVKKAHKALRSGGRIVLIDVPKESGYGIMYNLAKALGTWEHPLLEGVFPPDPYPMEFVNVANWRTTDEKVLLLTEAGFKDLSFAQTLTTHPLYSENRPEEPSEGCDRGDYVAITAWK